MNHSVLRLVIKLSENLYGRNHLGDLVVDERIILKWMLNTMWRCGPDSKDPVAGSYENRYEPSDSIKGRNVLDTWATNRRKIFLLLEMPSPSQEEACPMKKGHVLHRSMWLIFKDLQQNLVLHQTALDYMNSYMRFKPHVILFYVESDVQIIRNTTFSKILKMNRYFA
jgi:hypothetical protein